MPSISHRCLSSPICRVAILASTCLLSVFMRDAAVAAQTSSQFDGPSCTAPPTPPESDTWPVAGTDSLEDTTSPLPVAFSGASLLQNDRATTAVTLVRIAATSSNGGTITGTDPYVYTPAALFTGTDIFTYEIRDAAGETTTGVVKVVVNADVAAPTVSITAPEGGTVSGVVTITAGAADNVGVAGVTFFDGRTQVGAEVRTAPFSVSWDSRLVADGTHSLRAVARDAAGNVATSAAVVVNVVNTQPR